MKTLVKFRDTQGINIASYYLKTLFLWEVDIRGREFWTQKQGFLFMHMLKVFRDKLQQKSINYYWDKRYDLTEGYNDKNKKNICDRLNKIIEKIEKEVETNPMIVAKFILPKKEFESLEKNTILPNLLETASVSSTIKQQCGVPVVVKESSQQCAVSSTQKFLVQQHITTSKHQANKQLNSKQRQLFLTQPTTSNVRSEFNIDLCRSLISADIPLYKLKNKVFREFLEKYTQHTIPDESTLRKTYAPSIYDETIQKVRDEIKDSSIWVSIDETPDKEGRLVGNVVIGLLSEQYSERILLHCDVLEKCNNKTIVKLFNEAMGILWPKGIMYDNVLFFISDAAPYMVKAGQALSVVYPKLTHFTCVAHAFHRVAEVVRDNFPKVDLLISSVKKYFSKLPVELTC
ncbi:hypothetical protein ANN_21613 [Periplaneta americana]|uniref:DUF659 domain-containing protein n=1 Tax=Periplaneta americana TaxID=6978 RepID=A0ABQ8S5Y4_PERAM|nr:hypothetical protein ANN_21613 [Periplaneta americana]